MSTEGRAVLEELLHQANGQIRALEELVALLRGQRYGRSSEKFDPRQMPLFDEADLPAIESLPDDDEVDEIEVPAHRRKARGKRKPLPDALPRIEQLVDLTDEHRLRLWGQV